MSEFVRIHTGRIRVTVDREGANAMAARVGLIEVMGLCRSTLSLARAIAPVDTGHLRSQHVMDVQLLKTKIKGKVANTAKYAAAVHDGVGPHTIRARRGRVLRFSVGGRTVFARSVNHPGTRGNPWLATAAERAAGRAGFRFRRTVVSE
jgi:hypothetical protein